MKMWSTRRFFSNANADSGKRSLSLAINTFFPGVSIRYIRHSSVGMWSVAIAVTRIPSNDTVSPERSNCVCSVIPKFRYGASCFNTSVLPVEGHDLFRRGNPKCLIPQLLRAEVVGVAVGDEDPPEFRQVESQLARLHRCIGAEIELHRIAQQISGAGTALLSAIFTRRYADRATAEQPRNPDSIP